MLEERGIHLGPSFRGIRRLLRGNGEAVAEIELPASLADDCPELPIHPAALDACFQTLGATFRGDGSPVPSCRSRSSGRLRHELRDQVPRPCSRPARQWHAGAAQGDLRLFDERGHTIARIDGLSIARVRADGGPGRPARAVGLTGSTGAMPRRRRHSSPPPRAAQAVHAGPARDCRAPRRTRPVGSERSRQPMPPRRWPRSRSPPRSTSGGAVRASARRWPAGALPARCRRFAREAERRFGASAGDRHRRPCGGRCPACCAATSIR